MEIDISLFDFNHLTNFEAPMSNKWFVVTCSVVTYSVVRVYIHRNLY
jgi:hypothetical protein